MKPKKTYRVVLRKTTREEHTQRITGKFPPKEFITQAVNRQQAENNARHRFGPEGHMKRASIGYGEICGVECLKIEEVA